MMIGLSITFWFMGMVILIIGQQWLGVGFGFITMAAVFRLIEAIEK